MALFSLLKMLVPLMAGAAVMLFMLGISERKNSHSKKSEENWDRLLSYIAEDNGVDESVVTNIEKRQRARRNLNRWNTYWLNLFEQSYQDPVPVEEFSRPGKIVAATALVAGAAGSVLLFPIGIVAAPVSVVMVYMWKKRVITSKNAAFDSQLVNLTDSMKQNIAAGRTPTKALQDSIDDQMEPLRGELQSVKEEIMMGVPIAEVMDKLSERNNSREMKFLASAISLSVDSGAELGPQLHVIGEKLASRAKIRRLIEQAVASTRGTMLVTIVSVPAGYVWSYLSNREVWGSGVGFIATCVIFGLWILAMFIMSRITAGVKKY